MATRSVNDVRNVYEFLSAVAEGDEWIAIE